MTASSAAEFSSSIPRKSMRLFRAFHAPSVEQEEARGDGGRGEPRPKPLRILDDRLYRAFDDLFPKLFGADILQDLQDPLEDGPVGEHGADGVEDEGADGRDGEGQNEAQEPV